jgi:carboxylesterase
LNRVVQKEKPFPRDPVTGVILGAEPFDLGPKGPHAVLFLHGWTSSPRELRFLADRMAAAGIHCRGLLLKGHGLTVETLAPTRYSDYLAQSEAALLELSARHERIFVCGLSMGGLLGLDLAARHPDKVAGLILLAPFLRPWGKTAGLPNHWLIGRVPLSGNISKSIGGPIKDPQGAAGHIAYHAMPARTMVSVVVSAREVNRRTPDIRCPTLILHDVHDTTSDFLGSLDLIRDLGSDDKILIAFNRSNHILTLDYDRDRTESESLAWLLQRCTPKSP